MGLADVLIAAAALGAAVWLLWRSIRRTGASGCPGCPSGGCGNARREDPGLVRIGGSGGRGEAR